MGQKTAGVLDLSHDKSVTDIIHSDYKVSMDFPGQGNLYDVLSFGFSYVESEDHIVDYVVANSHTAKRIFSEISDSEVGFSPDGGIGRLWTAKLMLSNKLKDRHIVFSNSTLTVVLNLNTDPDREII